MAVSHVNVSALAAHTWSVHDVPHRAHGESGGGDGGGEGGDVGGGPASVKGTYGDGDGGGGECDSCDGDKGQYPQVSSHLLLVA